MLAVGTWFFRNSCTGEIYTPLRFAWEVFFCTHLIPPHTNPMKINLAYSYFLIATYHTSLRRIATVYERTESAMFAGLAEMTSLRNLIKWSMAKLPTYKGYVVDYRCRQFRSQPEDHGIIDFIDFGSERGDELLSEMIREGLVPDDILNILF